MKAIINSQKNLKNAHHKVLKLLFPSIFLLLIFYACQKDQDNIPWKATIGTAGGYVSSEDGKVKISIPEGSLQENVNIELIEVEMELPQFVNGKHIGKTYNLEPNGLQFLKPISVQMNYKDDIPNISNPDLMGAVHGSAQVLEVVPVHNDLQNHTITFNIETFSVIQAWSFDYTQILLNSYWVINQIKWYLEPPDVETKLNVTNIEAALNMWQKHTNSFTFIQTNNISDANIIFKEVHNLSFLTATPCALGIYSRFISGVICQGLLSQDGDSKLEEEDYVQIRIASDEIPNNDFEATVIAHEVGHALGISHPITNDYSALMNAETIYSYSNLGEWDISALNVRYESFQTFINNSTWDVTISFNSTTSWHAEVTFFSDGTTKYDEPANPGVYLTYGKWSVDNNMIHWDIGFDNSYIFDGIISGNIMSGTFKYANEVKSWSAIKK